MHSVMEIQRKLDCNLGDEHIGAASLQRAHLIQCFLQRCCLQAELCLNTGRPALRRFKPSSINLCRG